MRQPQSNKSPRKYKATTLLELTVSLIVLSVLVIVFATIDLFSQAQVLTVDRRSRIQNDLVYVLDHCSKYISRAIGNTQINYGSVAGDGGDVVKTEAIFGEEAGGEAIQFYVDDDADGTRDDFWVAYAFRPSGAYAYQLWFCPQCNNSACGVCVSPTDWGLTRVNTLSKKISSAVFTYNPSGNYVEITLTACWDPSGTLTGSACGASDKNPQATMSTRVSLPAVSIN